MSFYSWKTILKDVETSATLPAGMSRQGLTLNENVMLALHESLPNLKCKPHSHDSSQITYMLKGRMKMVIGGVEQIIEPGDFGYVPPNVEHSIESLDDYVLALDIFTPPRKDIQARLDEIGSK